MDLVTLANLEWKAGDKKSALANAEKSAKLAENPKGGRPMPVEPFERYAKSVEDGEPASMRDFSKWLSDALRKKAAASKAKAAPAQP